MRAERPERDDAGFSLAEVMITMAVMGVAMVLFTTAILQIHRTERAAESLTTAQSELATAFQRFDRQLRYASSIEEPGQVGTRWYVEFAGPDPTRCSQLRLETAGTPTGAGGVLQLLTWTLGTPPPAGTKGQTIASQIVTTGVPTFFERQLPGATPYASPSPTPTAGPVGADYATDFQRLRIRLTTRSDAGTASVDTSFTALNTSRDTPATSSCKEGRPTT